jgi:hypothetical protein
MKLCISTALLACSFSSLVACDQTIIGDDAAGDVAAHSPAITALEALGPERRIVPASFEETDRFANLSLESQALMDAKGRLADEGFAFGSRATAFWTTGDGEPLPTLVERGHRGDEQVMLITTWRSDLSLSTSFEVGGEGHTFEVHEVRDPHGPVGPGFMFVADGPDEQLGFEEGALTSLVGGTSTQHTLRNGIIDAGGQIADGRCLSEASFVCFWQYVGNERAFKWCLNERVAACQIGTGKWSAPSYTRRWHIPSAGSLAN